MDTKVRTDFTKVGFDVVASTAVGLTLGWATGSALTGAFFGAATAKALTYCSKIPFEHKAKEFLFGPPGASKP